MKRRLIKQGKGGYTVTVPIEWVREFNLKAGDDLDIKSVESTLSITPEKIKLPTREITLSSGISETNVRTLLANAYRAGFDKITLQYPGNNKIITNTTRDHLIGFEIRSNKKSTYVIESVAEPSYEDFENIMQRQFHIILDLLQGIEDKDLEEKTTIIQRYDNFLKRCISKKFFSPHAGPFFWQLISNLTQISRQCYYFNKALSSENRKLTKKEKEYLQEIEKMFSLLQKAYFAKDILPLTRIHEMQKELFYQQGPKLLSKHQSSHYLVYLARLVYLANSPLTGCLEVSTMP